MKKNIFSLLALLLSLSMLAGCNSQSTNPLESTDQSANHSTETAEATETVPETVEPIQANPVSDFEYSENDTGTITITQYVGSATKVIIPQTISNKSVTTLLL